MATGTLKQGLNLTTEEGPDNRPSGMNWLKWFVLSSGAVLLATGLAKTISALGKSASLQVTDPILGISFRKLLLLAGVLELVISAICFLPAKRRLAVKLVAWISTTFLGYRFGLWLVNWHRPCHCLGDFTDALHISSVTADNAMKVVLACLLIGSYAALVQSFLTSKNRKQSQDETGVDRQK